MGFPENRQQEIPLIRSGKQGVYHDIRKKRDDAFPGTAGAEAALKAFMRADGRKMGIQKGIHILPELHVFMSSGFYSFDLIRGKRVQMRCRQKKGLMLLLLIGTGLHLVTALAIGAVSGTGQIHAEINQFAGFDPLEIFQNAAFYPPVYLDIGCLKFLKRAFADAADHDGINGLSIQRLQGLSISVIMIPVRIGHGFNTV